MKKASSFFSVILLCIFFTSCSKDTDNINLELELRAKTKISICHHTGSLNNTWIALQVPPQSVKAHLKHGDAVDMDGDGFFHIENGCSHFYDINDDDPEVNCFGLTRVVFVDQDHDGLGDPHEERIYICGLENGGLCTCCEYVDNDDDCEDLDPEVPLNSPCPPPGLIRLFNHEPIDCET